MECRPKFEKSRLWSLQGTSQVEFSLFESCLRMQDQLVANSNVASTMTLRTWYFRESEDSKCPDEKELSAVATDVRACEKNATENCRTKNSKRILGLPERPGQNSTGLRLYPPPPSPK